VRLAGYVVAASLVFALGAAAAGGGQKLTARDQVNSTTGDGSAGFGYSVALSADGKTALIGGYKDNSGKGAAWIFTRDGSTWKQQGSKLTARDELGGAWFGQSVALSADGKTALIGGPKDTRYLGAAWVFTRSGSGWKQQAKLLSAKPKADLEHGFGTSVALSADGSTALVGAPLYNDRAGVALLFRRSGSAWVRLGKVLTGAGERGIGGFGTTVALSADGRTGVVGAPSEGGFGPRQKGAVWFFDVSASDWAPLGGRVTPKDATEGGQFGCSAALSARGQTVVIGACRDSATKGAAWIYTRAGARWREVTKLVAPTTGIASFGYSLALSSAGNAALVGAPYEGGGTGAAWIFKGSGTTWRQASKLTATGARGPSGYGFSVGLSANGETALVGGPNDSAGVGASWVR
jgi:hypothetical protein